MFGNSKIDQSGSCSYTVSPKITMIHILGALGAEAGAIKPSVLVPGAPFWVNLHSQLHWAFPSAAVSYRVVVFNWPW